MQLKHNDVKKALAIFYDATEQEIDSVLKYIKSNTDEYYQVFISELSKGHSSALRQLNPTGFDSARAYILNIISLTAKPKITIKPKRFSELAYYVIKKKY